MFKITTVTHNPIHITKAHLLNKVSKLDHFAEIALRLFDIMALYVSFSIFPITRLWSLQILIYSVLYYRVVKG